MAEEEEFPVEEFRNVRNLQIRGPTDNRRLLCPQDNQRLLGPQDNQDHAGKPAIRICDDGEIWGAEIAQQNGDLLVLTGRSKSSGVRYYEPDYRPTMRDLTKLYLGANCKIVRIEIDDGCELGRLPAKFIADAVAITQLK